MKTEINILKRFECFVLTAQGQVCEDNKQINLPNIC